MVETTRYEWMLTAAEMEERLAWREAERIADLELCERLVAQWASERKEAA